MSYFHNNTSLRIIDHLFIYPLPNHTGFFWLVNTIYGTIDEITDAEKEIIIKWKREGIPSSFNDIENALFTQLCERKHIETKENEDNQFQSLVKLLKTRYNSSPTSPNACFILSYNCNFRCPYCYEKDLKTDISKILSTEMVDSVFENNPPLENISFFGGEPLLPNHKDTINYIISKASPDTNYSIITNGYYLDYYLPLLEKIKISNIQITLDGSRQNHDRTRITNDGLPTYDQILKNVRKCANVGIPVTIRMNISKQNIEDCFAEKQYIMSQRWASNISFEMQPLFQTTSEDLQFLNALLLKNDVGENTNHIFDKSLPLFSYIKRNKSFLPILRTCDREGNTRYYDPLGNIYNCILAVGEPEKAIGSYFPILKLKEKSFLTRDITTIDKCLNCPVSLICGGGCPNSFPLGVDINNPNCYSFINECLLL